MCGLMMINKEVNDISENQVLEKQYILTFDDDILKKYFDYYFKIYPRRKKEPIKTPLHPSINEWFIMQRPQMNQYKQQWKDFTMFVVKYYGYENLNIKNCTITYKFFYNTKRRQDNDNRTPKFTNDGLVESGVLIDDDYQHLNPLIIYGDYDKLHSRMEIIIDVLEENT